MSNRTQTAPVSPGRSRSSAKRALPSPSRSGSGSAVADTDGYKILVKEKIAAAGVDLLREHFAVDVLTEMTDEELVGAIAGYEGIVIRSGTKLTCWPS